MYSYLSPGEHRSEPTDSSHPNNGSVAPIQNPPDSQNTIDPSAEHGEQDADDEAAEDTDDTRSVTSSDMSRSSSGTEDTWILCYSRRYLRFNVKKEKEKKETSSFFVVVVAVNRHKVNSHSLIHTPTRSIAESS